MSEVKAPIVFKDWLLDQYFDWIKKQGKPTLTVADFARAAGVSRQTIVNLLEGEAKGKPRPKTVYSLARLLGPEIYDVVGMKPPDSLDEVINAWDKLPKAEKEQIVKIVQRFT